MSGVQRELKNTEQEKQNEIQQLAAIHRQEKADLEHNFENKVCLLRNQHDYKTTQYQSGLRERDKLKTSWLLQMSCAGFIFAHLINSLRSTLLLNNPCRISTRHSLT